MMVQKLKNMRAGYVIARSALSFPRDNFVIGVANSQSDRSLTLWIYLSMSSIYLVVFFVTQDICNIFTCSKDQIWMEWHCQLIISPYFCNHHVDPQSFLWSPSLHSSTPCHKAVIGHFPVQYIKHWVFFVTLEQAKIDMPSAVGRMFIALTCTHSHTCLRVTENAVISMATTFTVDVIPQKTVLLGPLPLLLLAASLLTAEVLL